jgi:hypothetical protein
MLATRSIGLITSNAQIGAGTRAITHLESQPSSRHTQARIARLNPYCSIQTLQGFMVRFLFREHQAQQA